MANLDIKFDITETVKKLADLQSNFNLNGLLKATGLRLNSWVAENFKTEGGLVGKWAPLAQSTIARRRKGARSGQPDRILQDTGRLRQSFDQYGEKGFKTGLDYVEIGSQTIYARFQNEYWAKTKKPARPMMPTPKDAKSLAVKLIEARISAIRAKHG